MNHHRALILIPVKNLSAAKQRLSEVLSAAQRQALAQAMLQDVLQAIHGWPDRPPVALVTRDKFAETLARQFSFEIIEEVAERGETEAIEIATAAVVSAGAAGILVIPADIPLLQASELQQILAMAPREGCLLAPAADGRGTNAAWRCPGDLFPLRFGNDSFEPHLRAACATAKPCLVLRLPGIALDVDRPSDLQTLMLSPGETRSQRLLRDWDLRFPPAAGQGHDQCQAGRIVWP